MKHMGGDIVRRPQFWGCGENLMRELTVLEMKSVAGGRIAEPEVRRPVVEAIKRLLVRIIDSIRPGRVINDPRQA